MVMLPVQALDHVQIAAAAGSEDAMRKFYGGLLGCKEIAKPAALQGRGGVWFDCGNMQLHVGIDAEPPVNRPSRRHVAFRVSDLDSCRRELEAAGLDIEEDTAPLPHCRRLYLRDPAGNRVELVEIERVMNPEVKNAS